MSIKSKTLVTTGMRYSDSQKKEIVDFVKKYNDQNGRGGQVAAAKKYKVTTLSIATWLKNGSAKNVKAAAPTKGAKTTASKPLMASASGTGRGTRYTPSQKQEVIDFVNAYNAKNGRGGQSKAVEKFNISALTCAAWVKGAGESSKGAKTAASKVSAVTKATPNVGGKVTVLLEQMRKIENELAKLRANLIALK